MPNDDDFFKATEDALGGNTEQEAEAGIEKIEKLKIGEKEYTQDELERLVGLGELGRELEDKWSTKLDRLYPEYTKRTQEISELKKQLSSTQVAEVNKKAESGQELTPEEVKQQALAQARDLGIVTKDDLQEYVESYYVQRRSAERLLEDTESIVKSSASEGKPKTTTADLLEYMQEKGVKDPRDAYELMFKNELREWERQQLNSIKPSGLFTESRSTAGAKQPPTVKITKDNLESLVLDELNKGSQNI